MDTFLFTHSIHNIFIKIFLIYSMCGLGITAMNYGITDICYGITLKYMGITHSEAKW